MTTATQPGPGDWLQRGGAVAAPAAKVHGVRVLLQSWLPALLIALTLRLALLLARQPLHHDEALYGAWARLIASGQDPLLLTTWVDKPPLTLYLIATSFRLFGVSEWALRLPGLLASLLLIPATFSFARRAWGQPAASFAALLVALSPFAIAFAPTAFTDGWLTVWLMAAASAALAGRSLAAGALLGLAVASKQQGVLAIPLILALLAWRHLRPPRSRAPLSALTALGLAILGFVLIFGPLTYWDSLRWHNRPSFWDRSLQTYGPFVLAPITEWPGRAAAWAEPLGRLFAMPALSWAALGASFAVGGAALVRLRRARALDGHARRTAWLDVLLTGYLGGYLLLHIVITFQPWDRYLLPVAALVAVLVGRAGAALISAWIPRRSIVVAALLTSLLAWPASLAAAGRLPIGSNSAGYAGVAAAADLIRTQPPDAIIYYRALGWHFDFYLFDAPQERRWYGDGFKLAADAGQTHHREPDRAQWLALPAWEQDSLPGLEAALARQALRLEVAARVTAGGAADLTLFRLVDARHSGGQP